MADTARGRRRAGDMRLEGASFAWVELAMLAADSSLFRAAQIVSWVVSAPLPPLDLAFLGLAIEKGD